MRDPAASPRRAGPAGGSGTWGRRHERARRPCCRLHAAGVASVAAALEVPPRPRTAPTRPPPVPWCEGGRCARRSSGCRTGWCGRQSRWAPPARSASPRARGGRPGLPSRASPRSPTPAPQADNEAAIRFLREVEECEVVVMGPDDDYGAKLASAKLPRVDLEAPATAQHTRVDLRRRRRRAGESGSAAGERGGPAASGPVAGLLAGPCEGARRGAPSPDAASSPRRSTGSRVSPSRAPTARGTAGCRSACARPTRPSGCSSRSGRGGSTPQPALEASSSRTRRGSGTKRALPPPTGTRSW